MASGSPKGGSSPRSPKGNRTDRTPKHDLKITIISAKGLRAADRSLFGGSNSDPYVTCSIVNKPDAPTICTRFIEKTLNPKWDEAHIVEDYDHGDALLFNVYDHDNNDSHDFLGNVELGGFRMEGDISKKGFFEDDIPLTGTKKAKSTLKIRAEHVDKKKKNTDHVSQRGSRLLVTVVSCEGIRAVDRSMLGRGSSDPYCCVHFHGKPDSQMRTVYKPKTLEPTWDEELEMENYVRGDKLVFNIFDYDSGKAKKGEDGEILGKASLTYDEFDHKDGYEGEVKLTDCGAHNGTKKQTIKLKVRVLPPEEILPTVSVPGGSLRVKIIGAQGLRAADTAVVGKGSSDPYCIARSSKQSTLAKI
jgi:Ca2+-dependent lipid-binding protein